MKMILKKTKGITLIALVVTIVILLILASVTMSMIIGQNNIFTRAKTGRTDYEIAEEKEDTSIVASQIKIDKTSNKDVTLDSFQSMINSTFGDGKATGSIEGNVYLIKVNKTGNTYSISEDGESEKVDDIANVKADTTPGVLTGDGTTTNPYLIESIEDLVALSYNVNTGSNDYSGKNIALGRNLYFDGRNNSYADINSKYSFKIVNDADYGYAPDLASSKTIKEIMTTGEGFIPIGNYIGNSRPFKGNFDGKNHLIDGMYSDLAEGHNKNYAGLFGYVKNDDTETTFMNIQIQNANLKSKLAIGGVIGAAAGKRVNIINCKSNGNKANNFSGSYGQGGIIGTAIDATIKNCENTGSIQSLGSFVGGIIGHVDNDLVLENCSNSGDVSGNVDELDTMTAGIVGYVENTATIKSCKNYGQITSKGSSVAGICSAIIGNANVDNCTNAGNITAYGSCQGGVGANCSKTTFNKCVNTGKLSSNKVSQMGGISTLCISVYNSYNLGEMISTGSTAAGGIAKSATNEIVNCYNIGNITMATGGSPSSGIGNAATSINCYNSGNLSADLGAGVNFTSNKTVTNCYNIGNISGLYMVLGVASSGTISQCYNSGNISTKYATVFGVSSGPCSNGYNAGEISGPTAFEVCSGATSNCYYLTRTKNAQTGSATGLNKEQMDSNMDIQKFIDKMNSYVTTNNSSASNIALYKWKVTDGKPVFDI